MLSRVAVVLGVSVITYSAEISTSRTAPSHTQHESLLATERRVWNVRSAVFWGPNGHVSSGQNVVNVEGCGRRPIATTRLAPEPASESLQ